MLLTPAKLHQIHVRSFNQADGTNIVCSEIKAQALVAFASFAGVGANSVSDVSPRIYYLVSSVYYVWACVLKRLPRCYRPLNSPYESQTSCNIQRLLPILPQMNGHSFYFRGTQLPCNMNDWLRIKAVGEPFTI